MDDPRDKLIRQLQETVRQQQEVILRQQAVIEQLNAKVTQLERQAERLQSGKGKPKGMPGNKMEPTKPPKEKAPRKQRERNFVRVRLVPTHPVEHALEECDGCGMRLTHGSVKRTREVIDVPLTPATVTEHVFIERRCYKCGKRCVPKDVLGDVAIGKSRLGVGLASQDERLRMDTRLYFEQRLLEVCKPYLGEKQAVQHRLCVRIERHIKELFVFVSEPGVPSDNNGAERSLRHLVTTRKISGGTRSPAGTETKMTLASVFGTWQAQGLNPFSQCLQLLTSPQP